MKYFLCFFCLLIFSCEGRKKNVHAENALDAGREFIDGCLKGDFDHAAFYMKTDPADQAQLENLKQAYFKLSESEKIQLGQASMIILQDSSINDTAHYIQYSNSYDTTKHVVYVSLNKDAWQVHFP